MVERLLAAGAQPDLQKKVLLVQWRWEVVQPTKPLGVDYYVRKEPPGFVNNGL